MLINTQSIDEILEETGLVVKAKDLPAAMEKNNLSPDDLLSALSGIVHGGQSDATKHAAIQTGLKLNRMLADENTKVTPVFNIIINDSKAVAVNPILLPRELIPIEANT